MHLTVLGGNGFLGSHFARRAWRAGHQVTVIDRAERLRPSLDPSIAFVSGSTEDLARRPDLLAQTDALVHFAYSTVPATSNADPAADVADNVIPLVALVQSMQQVGLRKIVYISSGGAVYGVPQRLPIDEDHPLHPRSSYGVTKVACENYLGMFEASGVIDPVIVRPSNPYGPEQGKVGLLGAVTTFLDRARRGEPIVIWGDGSIVRDYVHVEDMSELLLAAVERPVPGLYNCGAGVGHSLNELAAVIGDALGQPPVIDFQPARSIDPPAVILDIARAQASFGWQPRITLAEGVARLVAEG